MSLARFLILLACLATLAGCALFRPRSSSRIEHGESSTLRYTSPESAGGRVGGG